LRLPMELQKRIEVELKEAIRARDENKRNAIRLVLTALKVKEKEIKRPLNEAEAQQVLSSQIKQRKDSVEQFAKAGRQDLVDKEESEIQVLQDFLPEALDQKVLERMIEEVISEANAGGIKDMGKVMKILMPKVAGRADGKLVNDLVRGRLNP
jgi:uncharacterized protein YqeY